jgi:hypothetical protein
MINEPSTKQQPTLTILEDGTKRWYLNGELHREDGPAIECANGTKWWYLNGKIHREDGPAIECANGTKWWYLNGKRHREDGSAIEWANGTKEWYFHGEKINKCPFSLEKKKVGDLVFINKQPAIIAEIGSFMKVFIYNKEVIYLRPETRA